MLSKERATKIVQKKLPQGRIEAVISFGDLFIFQVFHDNDPLEGSMDPFYSVNKKTKEFRDFSILGEHMSEIVSLFRKEKGAQ